MSFIPGYAEGYVHRQLNPECTQLLSEFRDETSLQLDKDKLLRKCDNVSASISENVEYCDFVIWTEEGLHHERIEQDRDLWEEICLRSSTFVKKVLCCLN